MTYSYDSAGRTSTFTGNLGNGVTRTYSAGIIYSPLGGMTKEQFGTDTAVYNKLFYNSRGQLAEIRESTSYTGPTDTTWNRGAIINFYSTCWGMCGGSNSTESMTDNNGNLKRQEVYIPNNDQLPTTSYTMWAQQYEYDSLNRLQRVHEYNGNPAVDWQQEYAYDRYGNRTIHQTNTWGTGINKKDFTVNTANNRLGVPGGQSGAMTYDNAGNLTTDTYSAAGVTRVYDAENRMTSETQANSYLAASYTYNADGQRVRRKVNGVETWQVYGFDGELLAEHAQNAAAASPQKEYGYRNGQLLITAEAPTSSSYQASTNFSTTQGQQNWYYLDSAGAQMTYISGNSWWKGAETYLLLWANGGHPGESSDAVRQWRAPQAGTIRITGSASDANGACGDGVVVSLKKGAQVLWQQTINNGDVTGYSYDLTTTVAVGDQINFLINKRGESSCDSTNFDPAIVYSPPSYQASTGFSNTQGQANWYYLDSAGAQMSYISGNNWWRGAETYNLLWANGGHPGESADAVRQWRAPQAGTIRISGNASDADGAGGDGVVVSIKKGAEVLWQQTINNGNSTGYSYDLTTTVAVGDQINFVINKRGENSFDSTNFDPTITFTLGGTTGGVQWLVTDQLGTPRMVFDKSGAFATVKRHDYLPFGKELFAGQRLRTAALGYGAADGMRQKFTS